MLIYKTVANLVKLGLRVYFRKIYFYNDEAVDLKKPILIASNHPTAFIEPLLIGITLKKPIFYLVRADVFKDGIVKFFTDAFGMIPIYRRVDGYSNLKNNEEIFKMLYKKLSENNIIVVFAEGSTIQEKRLRAIKKGTARIAFGAYEKYGLEDIDIIPTGVNYTYPNQYRKEVMIEFGDPIRLADYMDVYKEHPNRAIVQVTKELRKRMEDCIIGIDDKADDELVEQHFVMNRSHFKESIFPIKERSNKELRSEWEIADQFNKMNADEKVVVKKNTQNYFNQLAKHNLKDHSVLNGNQSFNIFKTIFLIIGFIPMVIGTIVNALPVVAANFYVKKKVKFLEFEAPTRFAFSLVTYLLIWLILFVTSLVLWNPYFIGFVILMPFIGYFALIYFDAFRNWNADRKYVFAKKEVKEELKKMRNSVIHKYKKEIL